MMYRYDYLYFQMKEKFRNSSNITSKRLGERIKTKTEITGNDNILHLRQQDDIQYLKSDTILSSKQVFSREEIMQAFYSISQGKQYIMSEDLSDFLADENESNFKKFQMVRLLDKGNKGFVNLAQFVQFYQSSEVAPETKKIPHIMKRRKEWIQCLQNNFVHFQKFEEEDFCRYVVSQIKKELDCPLNQ